jgi:hypothetical protein
VAPPFAAARLKKKKRRKPAVKQTRPVNNGKWLAYLGISPGDTLLSEI